MIFFRRLFAGFFLLLTLLSGFGSIAFNGGSAFLILTAIFCVLWLAIRPRKYNP